MELAEGEGTQNQERIVAAALELLHDDGFKGFSMRRLADRLGMTPGAAYRHFGGKDKILEIAADRILATIPAVSPDQDWREAFVANAHNYRAAFRRYPGLSAYLTRHLAETPRRKAAIGQSVAILTRAGLAHGDAMRTSGVLNAFLRASVGDLGHVSTSRSLQSGAASDRELELDDRTFAFGLTLLIGGIEAQIAASHHEPD